MAAVLIVLGLVVLGVALVAMIRGHLGWARIPSRRTAAIVLTAGVVVLGLGGVLVARQLSVTAADSASSTGSASGPAPTTAPPPTANPNGNTGAAPPGAAEAAVWDALAQCESGGDWAIDTDNGLYGGMQLDQATWLNNGGGAYAPLPNGATREQQIVVSEKVRAAQGYSPWSSCAATLGLR